MSASDLRTDRLIWIDLEMTGLDPDCDSILEIATLVTDAQLNELAVGPVHAIHHAREMLDAMDDWNREHHTESGLWQRVLDSTMTIEAAQQGALAFLSEWTEPRLSPMCGSSVCQDRRFLARLMPELEHWFHYRNLDVSTVKELARRWAPDIMAGFSKANRHEALSDIQESIAELKYYRRHMARLAGG
jgi:oligoribonuclease